jgi:hypothetical protein
MSGVLKTTMLLAVNSLCQGSIREYESWERRG